MQQARVWEYKVQLRFGDGKPPLGLASFDAITNKTFELIEAKDPAERDEAEKGVLGMTRAEFSAAAENPIKAWWYQSGHSSGSGKLKRVFLEEKAAKAEKRVCKDSTTALPAAAPSSSSSGIFC
jgi:hypothetical protein